MPSLPRTQTDLRFCRGLCGACGALYLGWWFLVEARRKVWHNTRELHEARLAGPEINGARLAELEVLSAAKVADLLAPGQVVLKLTVAGFGVTLPPPA